MRAAEELAPGDRLLLAGYLKHLARVQDPAYQAELTRLNEEIDAGRKFTLDQVQHLHDTLQSQGL